MSEQVFGYKGKRKVSIPDPLFLYIEWEIRATPENNSTLRELIEDLDMEYFPNTKNNIKNSLPFLTFLQAEMLFRGIKSAFGYFQLEGVALASQVKNNKLTGRPSTDDQPVVRPFIIDQQYSNLVIPLVEATFRDERFQQYSYDDLARYFTGIENNLFSLYGRSLGLSQAQIPQFPAAGTIRGALPRVQQVEQQRSIATDSTHSQMAKKASYYDEYEEPVKRDKLTLAIAAIGVLVGAIGLIIGMVAAGQLKTQKEQLLYLNSELKAARTLQEHEHEADVFGRYFLTYYYAGNKDSLKPFLSDGDARYTQPESATILSTILKNVKLSDDGKTYTMTYVITFKDAEERTTTKQVTFDCVEKNSADYGWVITAEPITKNFGPAKSNTGEKESKAENSDQGAEANNNGGNSSAENNG